MVAQPDSESLDRAIADIDRQIERLRAHSFEGFLPHWRFVNRETGDVQSFANLWPGQQRLVQAMHDHSWLLALKAGKLGFTELECAYDAWVLLTRAPNARVHLFSKNGEAARDLLQYVRYGLMHLPDHLRPKILADKAGGDTVRSLRVQPPPWLRAGPEDFRTIMSYNTERSASVDQTCLHGDSAVLTLSRGKIHARRIRNLVREQYSGKVMSVDLSTGTLVSKDVVGWHALRQYGQLYTIKLEHAARHNMGGQRSVHVTGDHLILTSDGWIRADDLDSGSLIASGETEPNELQRTVLTGLLLGDGHVRRGNKGAGQYFEVSRVDYEYSGLISLGLVGLGLAADIRSRPPSRPTGKIPLPQIRLMSRRCRWASKLRESWYPSGRKRVNRQAVESMGDLGLAVWFMDDGWIQGGPRPGRLNTRHNGGIATTGFDHDDLVWLVDFMRRNGIESKWRPTGGGCLYLSADGLQSLMIRIGSYIPNSMARKRTPAASSFVPGLWNLGTAGMAFDRAIVTPWNPPVGDRAVFCIDVEGTHNFVTYGGVMHNCLHSHIDELWCHPTPHETWSAIASTVAPGGSCHVITRGGGEANYVTTLWNQAQAGESEFFPFFEPWTGRPDRDGEWYANQATKMVGEQLLRFAPETPEDALESTDIQSFVPITLFDACRDVDLPVWIPDKGEVGVLAVDAGVHSDCFAVVAVTRHPNRPADPAIRAVKVWQPTPGRPVDLREAEAFIRRLCFGGCMAKPGHPLKPFSDQIDERYSTKTEGQFQCLSCRDSEARVPAYRIWEITFDPMQMEDMAQRLTREGINCHSFDQTNKRAAADRQIYDMIVSGRLAHNGDGSPDVRYEDSVLRQHVKNAAVQLQAKEESKMRIVKKGQSGGKIDALVAASMGVHRCLFLMLAPSRSS